jgi:uncharacterized zinc-type alcohol dehydrogenase-like protein
MDPYLGLLKIDATMVCWFAVEPLKPFHGGNIIMGRKRIAGSLMEESKKHKMLDFCGEHNIVILNLSICKILTKLMGVLHNVKYRFVLI